MKYIILAVVIALAAFYFTRSTQNKKIAIENKTISTAFLAENKANDSVRETQSGLQYEILKKGDGLTKPNATSTVEVHYHGTLLDGTVFDSSVERGQPISFPLNQVISGWTEGVQLMVEGDKFKFFIPSSLGYGNRATGKITPGALLIFEVELIEIK